MPTTTTTTTTILHPERTTTVTTTYVAALTSISIAPTPPRRLHACCASSDNPLNSPHRSGSGDPAPPPVVLDTAPTGVLPSPVIKMPGKMGSAENSVTTDVRMAKGMAEWLTEIGLGGDNTLGELPPPGTPYEACLNILPAGDQIFFGILGKGPKPSDSGLEHLVSEESVFVNSEDGLYSIELRIFRKKGTEGQTLPCFYHLHGGGFSIFTSRDPIFTEFLHNMVAGPGSAEHPCVAVTVEFRLTCGSLERPWSAEHHAAHPKTTYGPSPFPIPLDDCLSGVKYLYENKASLKISSIVTGGESAGGNLATAVALYAKRKGLNDMIDGVYSMCP